MPGESTFIVRGVITDSSLRPVPGVRVAIAAGPADLQDIAALTGDDGSFSFTVPQAGVYRVEAYAEAGHVGANVEVRPGQTTSVRIALPSG